MKSVGESVTSTWRLVLFIMTWIPSGALAHDFEHAATYLGNEGVLIDSAGAKVLFDPFFHKNFGIYQLVPDTLRKALLQGDAPYNNIDAVFISHAHEDHFNAADVMQYMGTFKEVKLIAPSQAVELMMSMNGFETIRERVTALSMDYREKPIEFSFNNILVDAVRIQHAGGERRKHIQNMVYRVAINKGVTVMHMGDAAPDDDLYLVHTAHWQAKSTDTAFPPYWFFSSAEGNYILNDLLNANHHIGVHVPMKVPQSLQSTGKDFFGVPGEAKALRNAQHQ